MSRWVPAYQKRDGAELCLPQNVILKRQCKSKRERVLKTVGQKLFAAAAAELPGLLVCGAGSGLAQQMRHKRCDAMEFGKKWNDGNGACS